MLGPEAGAVVENLLQALRFFGYARPGAEIQDLPGLTLIFCGLNYAAFNAGLLARPVGADRLEFARLIGTSAEQFGRRNLRWTYWFCDDYLDASLLRNADEVFNRFGLRALTEAPGMYAEKLAPPRYQLPPIEVHAVSDHRTQSAFAEIMSVAFEIPHSICMAIYASECAWNGEFRGYVGFSNGKAVATAAAMVTGDIIGLYSVATLPAHRRRGYAEAIMRQVIQETGLEKTVLQSTRSGLSLYKSMGYRTVTNFNVYIAD
jgi:ribosomal protein S18 acetylase RimI-like enzyme